MVVVDRSKDCKFELVFSGAFFAGRAYTKQEPAPPKAVTLHAPLAFAALQANAAHVTLDLHQVSVWPISRWRKQRWRAPAPKRRVFVFIILFMEAFWLQLRCLQYYQYRNNDIKCPLASVRKLRGGGAAIGSEYAQTLPNARNSRLWGVFTRDHTCARDCWARADGKLSQFFFSFFLFFCNVSFSLLRLSIITAY